MRWGDIFYAISCNDILAYSPLHVMSLDDRSTQKWNLDSHDHYLEMVGIIFHKITTHEVGVLMSLHGRDKIVFGDFNFVQ